MLVSTKQKKIIKRLADGEFHSGTELAEMMNVSRSAICKQLKGLSELGLEFNAVSGKGYCLEHSIQLLSEEKINEVLSEAASSLLLELEIHDGLSSTNTHLLEKVETDSKYNVENTGLACFAEFQSAGKGRRGREWVSPFGSNIYLSILWHFQSGPAAISGLSLAVGVAVVQALNACGIEDVGLKWPNDIYWQDKKLAGILIEVSGEVSGPCHAVIGLGLNFSISAQSAKSISQEWVDLNQILHENSANIRNKVAALLLNFLVPTIANFEAEPLDCYLEQWRKFDCMKGKQASIYRGKEKCTGIIAGIDDKGLLLLADAQGDIKAFASGEVSFRQL